MSSIYAGFALLLVFIFALMGIGCAAPVASAPAPVLAPAPVVAQPAMEEMEIVISDSKHTRTQRAPLSFRPDSHHARVIDR
jgi:hypothetical protein